MLSRTANSIYWLSRYIERAENVARFVDVNFTLALDMPLASLSQWQPMVATSGDEEEFNERYDEPNEENVVRFLTFDRDNPNSVLSCLWQARENARSVRDTISSELWEQVNRFYLLVKDASEQPALDAPHEFFQPDQERQSFVHGDCRIDDDPYRAVAFRPTRQVARACR